MIRDFLASTIQKKYFIMFLTSIMYIMGLFAFFSSSSILFASFLLILCIFAIIKNFVSPKTVVFWYFIFLFGFFNASFRVKNTDYFYQIAPTTVTLEGRITSIPTLSGNEKLRFFFEANKLKYNQKELKLENPLPKTLISVYTNTKKIQKFNIGDSYKIQGKLRSPFSATNPSQFDYGKYLKNYNVFTTLYADEQDCIHVESEIPFKWLFLQKLNNVRNEIINTHSKYLKSPNLEILGGIVFGDDAVAPPDYVKKSFQNSGLLHILAASGMNVALIYGIWFFILRKLKVPFNLTVSSGIFVVIFYALMTGLGPSVIRAAFMLIFILIGKLIDRDAHSISLLAFVALLMLIYNPTYINDIGFQLSFVVTFGLLISMPILLERITRIPNWLCGMIFVPIIAQLWVAPIQMYYFNSFSLYSILANISILPFLTAISFGGFISSVLSLIKPIANFTCLAFDFFLNPFLNCLVGISNYFSTLPHSLISMPKPSALQMFLYYAIIIALTLCLKLGKNKKLLTFIFISLLFLTLSCIKLPDNKLELIAFDVQNADAILLKTPKDKYFIIDSAKMSYKGGSTQAKSIVIKYLKDRGIKNIEALITHFDSDHAGGAADLIDNLNIKTIYVNSLNDNSNLANQIYQAGEKRIKLAKNNENIYQENDLGIKTYISNIKSNDNENSVITLVSENNFDELFMGDAGVDAFEKIKAYLPQKIEVLKVGHHGAKDVIDDNMLKRIQPDYAIISTGINNYGHPNGVTLELLKSHKVKTLRTDKYHAIKIKEQNNKYNVFSYNQSWQKQVNY